MSSLPFETSLAALNNYLGTSAGRDRIGKFVHYGSRGIAGVADDVVKSTEKGTSLHENALFVHQKSRSLFVRLMDARRTMRWLSSISIILTLKSGKFPWKNKSAFIASQLGMIFWQIGDHIRWLQQIGWLQGDQLRSKRISFTGFVLSSLINTMHFLSEFIASKDETDEEKKKVIKLNLIKNAVTLISTLHISELFLSHEGICGACGAIASSIDIYLTFPRVANHNKHD